MLKNRGRDPRTAVPNTPTMSVRSFAQRAPVTKPEPDYEVVEFPNEQYVNAKLQPPPPPPPRPPTGHPLDADASCGLCGGGGARVRCTECGRRALCASCDDMYHRHPKRRHHQRQALSFSQLRDERPPLPPKTAPPVPPPRKHKICGDRLSASPRPSTLDHRRAQLTMPTAAHNQMNQMATITNVNHIATQRPQAQNQQHSVPTMTTHMGSMPYLPNAVNHGNAPVALQDQTNTIGHFSSCGRQRGSLTGYNISPNTLQQQPQALESWEIQENVSTNNWGRPLRRGASVMELGAPVCAGCSHCASNPWRYGSCASLEHQWFGPGTAPWPQTCCPPHVATHTPRMVPHSHAHLPQTPQSYRRAENRAPSRAVSRAGSRPPSPAMSVRSRTSRRSKHRTPSPSPLPSSDADSESEMESDHQNLQDKEQEDYLGPAPPPPSASWQCEHCTFVNEAGVRVCVVCCRTPTVKPKIITDNINNGMTKLTVNEKSSSTSKMLEQPRLRTEEKGNKTKSNKERTSTACGPSPPREDKAATKILNRLRTPTSREQSNERNELIRHRHDIAVGPSPPKEVQNTQGLSLKNPSSNDNKTTRFPSKSFSPVREMSKVVHSVSVGPSPPRESPLQVTTAALNHVSNFKKKSVGHSPPREGNTRPSSRSSRTNTGTSPPPQSISTQTYEVPTNWDRAQSVTRSRPRRRTLEENLGERSHSRMSLSSDTRESERSVRTSGGRWEWREPRDSSPSADWSESDRRRTNRITRRASHLDLRKRSLRRSSMYGSEAPSPEPISSNRAISLEALVGSASRREAERGLELARLMTEAERLGFSAAEVHAALAQNPVAPLSWLSERWPSLCAGVRAAATKLAPGVNVSEIDARAALAKHRGAMWPAVNECVERCRRQEHNIGEEGRLRGHVWGPPTGIDDDAAPPGTLSSRIRADDSSDELEVTTSKFQNDDWMYLPLDMNPKNINEQQTDMKVNNDKTDIAHKLKTLLSQAGMPLIDEKLLLKGLLSTQLVNEANERKPISKNVQDKSNLDFAQTENDFIDAYNALTRLSPLPNLNKNNISKVDDFPIQNNIENDGQNQVNEEKPIKNILENKPEVYKSHKSIVKSKNSSTSGSENSTNRTFKGIKKEKIKKNKNNNNILPDKLNKIDNYSKTNELVVNEDKSNNLNEIVDSTQKLIQQMKQEINSDINSIPDKSDTQSEMGNSTSESHFSSEKESSYSESEGEETEDLTSEDNGPSYSDVESNESKKRLQVQRTSSEENDNFEEAMDHVEIELEEFKQSNIEMLNSIAKSLQADHNLEIKSDNPQSNQSKNKKKENEDLNNHLFAAVDSFDEIYAQLSNDTLKKENIVMKQLNSDGSRNTIEIKTVFVQDPQYAQIYTKDYIHLKNLIPNPPIKPLINEYKHNLLSARLESLEELEIKANGPQNIVNLENEIHASSESLNKFIQNTTFNTESNVSSNKQNHINVNTNIKKEAVVPSQPYEFNNNINNEIQNGILGQNDQETVYIAESTDLNEFVSKKGTNFENEHTEKSNLNYKDKLKTMTSISKSNIPKLIKTIQSNKQKNENKNLPKVIASKVPIRKASLKQYHAPNPPKSHLSNIQTGNIKQLQIRLFNDKTIKTNVQTVPEVMASTSTTIKKKAAPPPPVQVNRQDSPGDKSMEKRENNHFFPETCRTEDEWTESDSEEPKIPLFNEVNEALPTISTPQQITVRKISGQLVDLSEVRLSEGSPERQARMLLAEGAMETWEQAQLAVELVSQGINPPDAFLAALECLGLNSALAYLNQDCELCASKFPEHEMVSMLRCTHRCCRECAGHYFTVQVTERSIVDCVCPYCKEPELENLQEDDWLDYFGHVDILLKSLLETETHELFQRKLRDRTLARDPNFKWCVECSSGFFVNPKQKKLRCPECKSITCANCRKPWNSNHDGLSCDQYAAWLEDNDPERSIVAVQQHLKENGLDCPRCHFKYSLSRGGCMHFTCTQCKYEFCYGCGKPFKMGARCGLSEYCAKLGLHSHHPRNCLFYLRDKEPHELQTLLQMNNVAYEIEATDANNNRCPIQLQRETPTGLIDTTCGSEVQAKQAGLCKIHYVEYLAGLARTLDPIPIMEVSELVAELRRRAFPLPERGPWDTDPIYAGMCAEIVKEKIPLD